VLKASGRRRQHPDGLAQQRDPLLVAAGHARGAQRRSQATRPPEGARKPNRLVGQPLGLLTLAQRQQPGCRIGPPRQQRGMA
jgi:hypothetical protein